MTGAAGQISNHLLFMLASGEVFGRDQPVALQLLGSERSRQALEGVAMELEDSLYPLLREVKLGIDPYKVGRGWVGGACRSVGWVGLGRSRCSARPPPTHPPLSPARTLSARPHLCSPPPSSIPVGV